MGAIKLDYSQAVWLDWNQFTNLLHNCISPKPNQLQI